MELKSGELAELRPLRAVSETDLQTLMAFGELRELARDEVVLEVDQQVPHALLVVRGRLAAQVIDGGQTRSVGDIWPGEITGESALFGPGRRSQVRVVAMAPSAALVLSPELVQAAAGTRALASLQEHLVHVMSRRIRSTNLAIRRAWQDRRSAAAQAAADHASRPMAKAEILTEAPPPPPGLLDRLRTLLGGG